jgi:hypothetical protein
VLRDGVTDNGARDAEDRLLHVGDDLVVSLRCGAANPHVVIAVPGFSGQKRLSIVVTKFAGSILGE